MSSTDQFTVSSGVVICFPPQVSRELHQSRPSPENYMSTGCLLAKYGATFDKENLTNDFGCSTYFVTLLVSYSEKRSSS